MEHDDDEKKVPPPTEVGSKRKAPDTRDEADEENVQPTGPTLDEIEGTDESELGLDDDGGDDDADEEEVGVVEEEEEEEEESESDSDFVDHRYDHITRRPGEIIRHAGREPEPVAPPVRTRSGRVVRPPVRFVASTRIDGCIDENDYDLAELKMIEDGFGDSDDEAIDEQPEVEEVEPMEETAAPVVLGGFVQADPTFMALLRDDDYKPSEDSASESGDDSSETLGSNTSSEESGVSSGELSGSGSDSDSESSSGSA